MASRSNELQRRKKVSAPIGQEFRRIVIIWLGDPWVPCTGGSIGEVALLNACNKCYWYTRVRHWSAILFLS